MSDGPKTNPGDILGWPFLKIDYPTDADGIARLLPPGIDPSDSANVHLSIYNFPVPDEPEYGVVVSVDANYRDMNGQPKYPAEIVYFRLGERVSARATHQRYTFLEFEGKTRGVLPNPEPYLEHEWWVKVSRAVGGAEKAYDFPPHVVKVATTYKTFFQEKVDGELLLRESPWDPIATLLPQRGDLTAKLQTAMPTSRDISLEGALDPDAFWPHVDTISGSRWPGHMGGPKKTA
jgi:acetoacetate decarboxylase